MVRTNIFPSPTFGGKLVSYLGNNVVHLAVRYDDIHLDLRQQVDGRFRPFNSCTADSSSTTPLCVRIP